ncbi:MAG: hypothetical protein J6X55_08415 [Victivallales bacterium]|nr:hypothetical protein [Victivallales bacterium]
MDMSQLEKSYYSTLIRSMSELLEMKPWLALESTDIFAVRDPNGEELLFIQISGGDGEPFELMAYRGAKGLEMLWELNNCENNAFVADQCVDVPALFCTFVSADELDNKDREVMEDVEAQFSDAAFPVFRSCCPGYQPSHLTEQDVFLMMQVVRQTCEVVRMVNEGILDFNVEEGQEDSYILRKPVQTDDGVVWENDRIDMNLDDKLPRKIPKLKRVELSVLKELPLGEKELRMDLMVSPFVSHDENEDTPSTFLFTVTDYQTGDLVCARVEEPGAKLQKFRDSLLQTFQEILLHLGERPKAIHIESYALCDVLGDVLGKLDMELAHHELPAPRQAEMDAVLKHLSTRFTRQPGKIFF